MTDFLAIQTQTDWGQPQIGCVTLTVGCGPGLLSDPVLALCENARLFGSNGQVCVLNPSERMSLAAASELAENRSLQGIARDSLLNWARRSESLARWNAEDLNRLFAAGLHMVGPRSGLVLG